MNSMTDIEDKKELNLQKIRKMAAFEYNWNGNGGLAFSETAIKLFMKVIETLNDLQPDISPSGRNSLVLHYELDDESTLDFEVSENSTEKVYLSKGDYSSPRIEMFTDNVPEQILRSVTEFYVNQETTERNE